MKALNFPFKIDNNVSTLLLRLLLGVVFFPHGAQLALGWFGGYGFNGTMGFCTGTLLSGPSISMTQAVTIFILVTRSVRHGQFSPFSRGLAFAGACMNRVK